MTAILPKVSKLSERVIRVLGCNPGPFTLQGTNTYLIGTGSNRILLDTGEAGNNEYVNVLQDVLKSNQIKLSSIIISHWHPDHIGGLKDLLNLNELLSDCKILKFKNDKRDPKDDKIRFEYLQDEQWIQVDDSTTLKIYCTPGHTADHAVIYLIEEGILFSGDCVLGEGSTVFEDLSDYLKSLEKILTIKPKKIYPGHGPVVLEPEAKVKELVKRRMIREKQIIECIKSSGNEGITITDIVAIIFKDKPKSLYPAAAFTVTHHLEKLLKDGVINSDKKTDQAKYWIENNDI